MFSKRFLLHFPGSSGSPHLDNCDIMMLVWITKRQADKTIKPKSFERASIPVKTDTIAAVDSSQYIARDFVRSESDTGILLSAASRMPD